MHFNAFQSPCEDLVRGKFTEITSTIIEPQLFQSPCGDLVRGKSEIDLAQLHNTMFQSPCGDLVRGKLQGILGLYLNKTFQSPCGDLVRGKPLLRRITPKKAALWSFSPLAGI